MSGFISSYQIHLIRSEANNFDTGDLKNGGDGQGVYEQAIHLMGCEVKLSSKYISLVVSIYYPVDILLCFKLAVHFWHFELCLPSKYQRQETGLCLNWRSCLGRLNACLYYLQFYFSLVSLWTILIDKASWMLWWEQNQKITSLITDSVARYAPLNSVSKSE